MDTTGPIFSSAVSTEREVRAAFEQTSVGQMFKLMLSGSRWWHWVCFFTGLTVGVTTILWNLPNAPESTLATLLMLVSGVMVALAVVKAQEQTFRREFLLYGGFLHRKSGEPSRLRYLQFLAKLKASDIVSGSTIEKLIPALEARLAYRDSFFKRHPLFTMLGAFVVILFSIWMSQPFMWATDLGVILLGVSVLAWLMGVWVVSQWRIWRPNSEANERELLAFLHFAVIDMAD